MLVGPTVASFALDDLPQVAKAIVTFGKSNDLLTIKGGLMGDKVLEPNEVRELAKLPTLPIQRAQMIGLISAPATNITGALAGNLRQVLNVLRAYADGEPSAVQA
jgi:large subunit ribosomal protein L10